MKSSLLKPFIPTESEAAANHAGMNTFFGAVLGFVMAGTERLDSWEFALLLIFVAGTVISILYVSASKQKLAYSVLTIVLILMLPRSIAPVLEPGEDVPAKLQATLLVWTLMTIAVEFLPRRAENQEEAVQPAVAATLSGKSEPNTR